MKSVVGCCEQHSTSIYSNITLVYCSGNS